MSETPIPSPRALFRDAFNRTVAAHDAIAHAIFGDRPQIWDAFEQGQFARAIGAPKHGNPFRHPALGYHVNVGQWDRGWERGVAQFSVETAARICPVFRTITGRAAP